MSRIFWATIGLIIYGSLYPWQFHARELSAGPVWILIHSWPTYSGANQIKDVVVNFALYAPLGLFGFLSLSPTRGRVVPVAAPVAIGFALACSLEILQLFDDGRFTSALDAVSDTVGSGIGVVCGVLFESRLRRIQKAVQTIRFQQRGSLLLLICLAAYQLSPFLPEYGVTRLQQKLMALAVNEFSVMSCLVSVVAWLAIARLVETAIDPQWASRAYVALLMMIPAKMLIVGHTTNFAEVTGAALACLIWRYRLRLFPRRAQCLAALFTALMIFRGLSPDQFGAGRVAGITILLGKLFVCGTFVWLLRDAGLRAPYAAAGAAATLGAIEAAQMFLPGRAPAITDPLLALLVAWILWLVDDSRYASAVRCRS